jgi:signal transduction histidine kinase
MTELRPFVLDDYGLMAAVRAYGQELAQRGGLSVTIDEMNAVGRLSPATETALFRIVQEALTNVIRHAHAAEVCITCETNPAGCRIVVADNGTGFDVASRGARKASWGLTIMRERARAVGCELSIESSPGKGTSVIVDIPASAKAVRLSASKQNDVDPFPPSPESYGRARQGA